MVCSTLRWREMDSNHRSREGRSALSSSRFSDWRRFFRWRVIKQEATRAPPNLGGVRRYRWVESAFLHRRICKPSRENPVTPERRAERNWSRRHSASSLLRDRGTFEWIRRSGGVRPLALSHPSVGASRVLPRQTAPFLHLAKEGVVL